MPLASVNGLRLYYEEHGDGFPLLLIEGLGYALWMWERQLPVLARHFRVVAFDNRGIGRSDQPEGPYTIADMADDAAGLLDALGIRRAHVLGISMGGMIAQELALRHSDRVERLILGCTHCGGADHLPTPPETTAVLTADTQGMTLEQVLRRNMALAFAPTWPERHPEEFQHWIRVRLAWPVSPDTWRHQFQAIAGHDTSRRLHQISHPTLVCTGDRDRVVPADNSRLLAERIPHARLEIFPGAGHLFFIEQADRFNDVVVEFLKGGVDA